MAARLELRAIAGIPHCEPGADLAVIILEALARESEALQSGDVLVVAQKIVSKTEGRYANLNDVVVSAQARDLAAQADKDPRLVELILSESREVLRVRPGVIVVEHRNGYVHANAGIDRSNIPQNGEDECALLLPVDANASAERLRAKLSAESGVEIGVIVSQIMQWCYALVFKHVPPRFTAFQIVYFHPPAGNGQSLGLKYGCQHRALYPAVHVNIGV